MKAGQKVLEDANLIKTTRQRLNEQVKENTYPTGAGGCSEALWLQEYGSQDRSSPPAPLHVLNVH